MGKLKISKAKKDTGSKGSSGIPNWLLSLLVVLVVVAVAATCIGSYLVNAGVPGRLTTVMSVGNYKVNEHMMNYYYQSTRDNYLQNQYNQFQQYAAYLGDTSFNDFMTSQIGYNPSISPAEQKYTADDKGENLYETWQDYFVAQTKTSVEDLLQHCAEADALGVSTLTEEDEATIKTECDALIEEVVSTITEQYASSNISTASLDTNYFLNQYYGSNVRKSDLIKAMTYAKIASNASTAISDKIEGDISDDLIQSTYDENKLDYQVVDYFTYALEVRYADVVEEKFGAEKNAEDLTDAEKAEVLAIYKEKIAKAREDAAELAKKTTLEEFQKFAVEHTMNKKFEEDFTAGIKDLETGKLPSDDDLKKIKEQTKAAVIKEVNDGKTEVTDDVVTAEDTYTLYGISITKEFAEAVKSTKSKLFDTALSAKENNLYTGVNYVAPNAETEEKDVFSEWAFADVRKANDVTKIEDGDGKDGAEVKVEEEVFTADVSILTKTAYLDESVSKRIAFMLFTDEETAKSALEAVAAVEGLNEEKFHEIAEEKEAANHQYVEEYWDGNMGDEGFDEWLATAEAGSYTKEALVMSDGSFMIAYYEGANDIPAWKADVKNDIFNDKYEKYIEDMSERHTVTTNDKAFAKMFA